MAKSYNFFEGSQTDINRRLLRKIESLETTIADLETRIEELEND